MSPLKSSPYTFVGLLLLWLCTGYATTAVANPWTDVGDERTRHHLQYLNDTKAIRLPLSAWPIPWIDIQREIEEIAIEDLDHHQLWSYRYVRHALDDANRRLSHSERLYASNSLMPFTDFAAESREQVDADLETVLLIDRFAANLSLSRTRQPFDDDIYRPDGSFIAASLGNWIIGGGAIDRWWGPGWQSSLILSNSSRPAPGIFIRRKESAAVDLPLFSALGPWTLDLFASQLEKERSRPKAKLIGGRLTMAPLNFMELGYSRATIRGGDEPLTEIENPSSEQEENLELISYDGRLNFSVGSATLALYGQHLNNKVRDDNKSESATLLGTETGFPFHGVHTRLAFEIADSENEQLTGGNPIYDNGVSATGYRRKGRNIGESAGSNALKKSVTGEHFFANGHQLSWRLMQININRKRTSKNVYTAANLDQHFAELAYKLPLSDRLMATAGVFVLKEEMQLGDAFINSGSFILLETRL